MHADGVQGCLSLLIQSVISSEWYSFIYLSANMTHIFLARKQVLPPHKFVY